MIERIVAAEEIDFLPEKGIEAQKIRALIEAYGTSYDFCRFYRQNNVCVAWLDGSVIVCSETEDAEEISHFLEVVGYSEIFCSVSIAFSLQKYLQIEAQTVNLMRFVGKSAHSDVDDSPSLSDVYDILKTSFSIEFEPWYLDMSHRVRHGVAKCFMLDSSPVCVLQHNINGEALISQVATLPEKRDKGIAKRLLLEVCRRCGDSEVSVLCEDALIKFYENVGFEKCGECSILV